MKNLAAVLVLFVTSISFGQNTIEKKLGEFSTLKVYNGIDIELIKGDENLAIVAGEKTDKVKIKQVNNTLKFSLRFPETLAEGQVKVSLYYTGNIATIDANEGAIITAKEIEQNSLTVKGQEGAFINMVVKTKHLNVKATSGAIIKLSGNTKNQTIKTDLGGIYHGYAMGVSDLCTVTAGSGAKAEVQAGETLDAKVSFGGSIFYQGTPEILKDKKVIGGTIKQRS